MPQGVPVATVAINGAHNAALLALQILALSQDSIREKLIAYKMKLKKTVDSKASELEQSGYKLYLKKKKDDGKIS